MRGIQIERATKQDVPTILDMIRRLADYERLPHMVTANEDQLRRTLFGERPAAEVLLAQLDGRQVGFAVFFTNYSTFLAQPGIYLEDLFVIPEERGKGVGKALLAHIARLAVERDCGRVEWAVLKWNDPAIQFYKKLGAVQLDDWTVFRLVGEALTKLSGLVNLAPREPGSEYDR